MRLSPWLASPSGIQQRPSNWKHVWTATTLVLSVLLVSVVAGCQTAREADDEYELALDQIDRIQERLGEQELTELKPVDLAWLEEEFQTLSERVERMDDLSSLPLGLDRVAEYGSPKYRAMMEMLEVARLLAESGEIIASIGHETLTTLEDTGIRFDESNDGETWLEVIDRREDDLNDALELMDRALSERASIDEDELPGRVQGNLEKIDQMIERFESQLELIDELPLAYEALGADQQRQYLVLFQNPAELRPTGGFVGTIALVDVHRGQIRHYDFQDVYEISSAYAEQSEHEIEAPLAIQEFVRSDKLQFQDANWWADFPESTQLLMEMAEAVDWGTLEGVVAVQPETIQELINVTGPITVDVDGEDRLITSENLHEESERQRRIQREGEEAESDHKEVIESIGDILIDELSQGDREQLVDAVYRIFDRLDQRDMQAYYDDESVQAFLEDRNWAGLRIPEPETPTISPVFANITGLKTSLTMQPGMHLELERDESAGFIDASLTLTMDHLGDRAEDPFYQGFQRYWVDLLLPDGAEVIESVGRSADDSDASNGGAFIVNLDVEERQEIVVHFTMDETDRLLIRRQPGLRLMEGSVSMVGCDETVEFQGDQDIVLAFENGCPVIELEDDDWTNRD